MAVVAQTIFSDVFSWIEKCIVLKISPKFVPKGPIDNKPAVV